LQARAELLAAYDLPVSLLDQATDYFGLALVNRLCDAAVLNVAGREYLYSGDLPNGVRASWRRRLPTWTYCKKTPAPTE
jgi:hypothetical protein